ncbi:MAG: hypothetical protein ABF290_07450, partial [Thiogranum sp.]
DNLYVHSERSGQLIPLSNLGARERICRFHQPEPLQPRSQLALQANLAAGGSNGKCRIRNDWVNSVYIV